MDASQEFDYHAAIDRLIGEFKPASRLWPIRTRLLLWIALGLVITIAAWLTTGPDHLALETSSGIWTAAAFGLVSTCAAWLALRSAIPGREVGPSHLGVLFAACLATLLIAQFSSGSFDSTLLPNVGWIELRRLVGLAALPWLALFWAARRGVPLFARKTGSLIGLAAFSFAVAVDRVSATIAGSPLLLELQIGVIIAGIAVSAITGALWLNPDRLWLEPAIAESRNSSIRWLTLESLMPLALAGSVALLVFSLRFGGVIAVPDFDRVLAGYDQALSGFDANVPSHTIDAVLKAYIEHGMPAYMWDFGPQGFKLVGGRFDHLPDGQPITFTWFRGTHSGIMCVFRKTTAFAPPPLAHIERDGLLFYRYRGFSVCLINVGNYGNFISVIASPMPMERFLPLVVQSAG